MPVSVYQVDSVIKAYNKHVRTKVENRNHGAADAGSHYRDCVTISPSPENKAITFEKISYNIRDIIVKSA
ncbi:MAG: hypothetical protein A4E70_00533 [Syntrophus sp. PtaU1.Bin005]|jgi:hypothetical protein|uniref:hypothetical protein n=1 Tax=Syntrophus TaxID=43773 RepID=UPI0009CF9172|nr:MAG: hypothetical protein A4E69_03169 [Syntrophus sp. PtaB.Bin138]OPY82916.1 MAG: hypothetical protein A4E70_00533 [Syntrophus sp. PtaU1.Bin005]